MPMRENVIHKRKCAQVHEATKMLNVGHISDADLLNFRRMHSGKHTKRAELTRVVSEINRRGIII